jgi:hypothetical protein
MKEFYKEKPTDKVYWVEQPDEEKKIGEFLFSFDKKKIFNLFADYPHALTAEQKRIFNKENPFWADFFAYRK